MKIISFGCQKQRGKRLAKSVSSYSSGIDSYNAMRYSLR